MSRRFVFSMVRSAWHRACVVAGSVALTLAFFLVLPLLQTITKPPGADMMLQPVDTANIPPPPPPPEPEPEKEEEKEEPPELTPDDAPPLDLSQLELVLNPGFGGDWIAGDIGVNLGNLVSGGQDVDALFSLAELDQKPRVIWQPNPVVNAQVRKKTPGTVYVLFVVDQTGKVESPMVQNSTDPVFEKPAVSAVKQWRFEPGKRNGEAVRFRMRVPITFPRGQ